MFEQLESRRMFSVGTPVVQDGILKIVGDSANDQVRVSKLNASQIVVEDFVTSQSFTFIASNVSKISFEGNAGNDRFEVVEGTGTRRLNLPVDAKGGEGNDTLISTGGADKLDGGAGDDSLSAGAGNDTLFGGAGLDTLVGDAGDDQLDGGTDKDTINGGEDDDTVSYATRTQRVTVKLKTNISLNNGEGNEQDILVRIENAVGGSGSDILVGTATANKLFGNGGNDKIKGLGGNDRLEGGNGNDTLSGAEGADDLVGGNGNDLLIGGDAADDLSGNAGNDTLIGGSGRDAYSGGSGDDFIFAQDGQFDPTGGDLIDGGTGSDVAETDPNDVVNVVEELLN